jgi:N-methylhydantoinase A
MELEADCLQAMARAGVARDDISLIRSVDLRYRRQTNDLNIPMPERPATAAAIEALVGRFEATYEQTYGKGSAFREAGIELTNVRVEAFGRSRRPEIRIKADGAAAAKAGSRRIFEPVAMKWMDTAVYNWRDLPMDFTVTGPAVIEHPETSVFVAAGQVARLDENTNITMEQTKGA